MSQPHDHDSLPPSSNSAANSEILNAPTRFLGILKRIGPGLIIAGSIVGSGELIATTKTGAQAGISLLWLIVIGCIIKVFVQVELGRYAITYGETTLAALNRVPGPRLRANWIVWFWLLMMVCSVGQLGGIVGGVGQALALSLPIRGDYAAAIRIPSSRELQRYLTWDDDLLTEWDVKLYLQWRDQIDRDDSTRSQFEPHESRWVRRTVQTVGKLLTECDAAVPGRQAEVIAATRELLAAEQELHSLHESRLSDPAAVESGRSKQNSARWALRTLLDTANRSRIEESQTDASAEDSPLQMLREQDPAQQERILNGHAIIAQQLAELNRDDNQSIKVLAAAARLLQTKAVVADMERELEGVGKQSESSAAEQANLSAIKNKVRIAAIRAKAEDDIVNVLVEPVTTDDKYWAAAVALFTCALLYHGRYGLIQNFSMALVVGFTFITIGNVLALQNSQEWHIPTSEFVRGMSLGLPTALDGSKPILTALAAFGIIGVGASELIAYPYWCLEKGYARFTGPRTNDESWARRARGWVRIMTIDAFASMVIYTLATLAFFIMGVAVLYNEGRDPDGMRMVSTLAAAYVPIFGEYARWLFLIGAIAVLYSTFMVANAGNARMLTDAMKIFGLLKTNHRGAHERSITVFSVLLPLLCLMVFVSGANPVYLVLLAGTMQAILLPMIGFGSLYFRFTRTDERLKPSPIWDLLLIVSCLGLLVAGTWGVYSRLS